MKLQRNKKIIIIYCKIKMVEVDEEYVNQIANRLAIVVWNTKYESKTLKWEEDEIDICDLPGAEEDAEKWIKFLTDCGWNVNSDPGLKYQNICENDFIRI